MRILIIEDELDLADFLKTHLQAELFVVDIAPDGERGLSLGGKNEYDLIILDITLPRKNGLDVLRRLREMGKTLPILVLSATSDIATKVECLSAGADDYVVKPGSFTELVARVRALLRRPRETQQELLVAGTLTLDSSKHEVKRGQVEIRLTRKEFMLLEYLLRHRGSVVTRSNLLEHVWDMKADPFSNIVEAHMVHLRRKIHRPGEKPLIETLSGIGYKIS